MFEYKREYKDGLKYPKGCCLDSDDNVYIVDNNNHRLIKLDSNLQYVSQFGTTGIAKTDNTGLSYPYGCCADSNDNIYIVDSGNYRLIKLNKDLQYVSQFGVTGVSKKDNTGFNRPSGCCIDSNGNIYVSDSDNHRLVKLNSNLQYVSQFGTTGTAKYDNTGLNEPMGCCIDSNGNIFVVERSNQRLTKLNSNLQYVSQFGTTNSAKTDNTGLNYPQYCSVDFIDNIYITDSRNQRLIKLNPNLQYITQFGFTGTAKSDNTGLNGPHMCYIDKKANIYIADAANNRVINIKQMYEYETQFGVTGTAKADNTGLNYPIGCAVDSIGNIFAADYKNNRIMKFNKNFEYVNSILNLSSPQHCAVDSNDNVYVTERDGNKLSKFSNNLEKLGEYISLKSPKGCCIDSNDNIYITDTGNNKLVKLDNTLTFVQEATSSFNSPEGCCVDYNGNVYITDYSNSRLVKLDSNLEYVGQFGVTGVNKSDNTGLYYPSGCCVDSNGNIYVCDILNNRLVKLNSNLEYVTQFGITGSALSTNTGLNYPQGCCIDSNDNIYITDSNNHRLIKLKYLNYIILLNICQNKNTPALLDIQSTEILSSPKLIINNVQIEILNNKSKYKYNLDKIWDTLSTGLNTLKIETEKGSKEISFIKPEYEDSIFNNVECKPLVLTYSLAPSYDEAANPIPFNYTVSIDSTVLFTEAEDKSSIVTNSISIPFATLVNKKYNLDAIRNIQIQKVETGKTISYNIPVKLKSQKVFSKYFNGVNNYISISKWTKPLNELTIQVIAKKDTEDTFSVITDNSLISLSNDVLKIGGVSAFTGNIYEIRVWLKEKEQTYDSKYQIDENEDGLYALYRLNEYNSKTVFDSCINKLNGIFIGEFLKQEVVPTDSSNLFKFEIESKEEDVVTQKSNYDLKYRLASISSNYKQIFGVDGKTEVTLPINNINIIENLIIRTNDSFETTVQVGQALLNPEKGWKRIDESDSNIQYTNFTASTNATGNWNNTLHQCNRSDGLGADLIKFKFNGTRLRIVGLSHDYYPPKIEVKIDGNIVGEFSTRYTQLSMRLLYQITGLKRGEHIVELVCRSASSYSGYGYAIDAFDIDESGKMIALT